MHFTTSFVLLCLASFSSAVAIAAPNTQSEPALSSDAPDSTNGLNITQPLILTPITGAIYGLHSARTDIGKDGAFADDIAYRIKQQSNQNSCSTITGDGAGVAHLISWEYFACTSGPNCDTTSQLKTVRDFVGDATSAMSRYGFDAACVRMKHGSGTWTGYLQIADHNRRLDADPEICSKLTYRISLPRDGL